MNPRRLNPETSLLLVIDIQEKLLASMPHGPNLVREVSFLVDVANLLQIPILTTEQYPQGLGPTHLELAKRLPTNRPGKTSFSCCGAAGILTSIQQSGRPQVVLVGMETHVCVLQTVLDLREQGFKVFLPVDGLMAGFQLDHDIALRRAESNGSILTTVEATAFEWLGGAEHPQFKTISKMVRERRQALRGS